MSSSKKAIKPFLTWCHCLLTCNDNMYLKELDEWQPVKVLHLRLTFHAEVLLSTFAAPTRCYSISLLPLPMLSFPKGTYWLDESRKINHNLITYFNDALKVAVTWGLLLFQLWYEAAPCPLSLPATCCFPSLVSWVGQPVFSSSPISPILGHTHTLAYSPIWVMTHPLTVDKLTQPYQD